MELTKRDIRALRGCCQRGGGTISDVKAQQLMELGLIERHEDYNLCYLLEPAHYRLTLEGRRQLAMVKPLSILR